MDEERLGHDPRSAQPAGGGMLEVVGHLVHQNVTLAAVKLIKDDQSLVVVWPFFQEAEEALEEIGVVLAQEVPGGHRCIPVDDAGERLDLRLPA